MPIRSELRIHYGPTWRKETRPRILARAGNCCESCNKPDRAIVETITGKIPDRAYYWMFWRIPGHAPGNCWFHHQGRPSARLNQFPNPNDATLTVRTIRVVLTVGHMNNVAGDDRDENLRAWCQWCHLIYDLEHHHHTRADRKDAGRPLLAVASGSPQVIPT